MENQKNYVYRKGDNMRWNYRITDAGIEIMRVYGWTGRVRVPEMIDGEPVVQIAPYTFSAKKQDEEESLVCDDGEDEGEAPCICGERVEEVILPLQVAAVGNYAFYGCRNLKTLCVTDRLIRMGSGVFTGCRLSHVKIICIEGEKTCLKEILTEIRYELTAELELCFQDRQKKARVVFPEYYADAVENTPARIVETHYYGSGGDYRECFYRRELDFGKYDRMFILSKARDEGEVTACLALSRLRYPWKLSAEAEEQYREYVKDHSAEIVGFCVRRLEGGEKHMMEDPLETVAFLCREGLLDGEQADKGIEAAAKAGQTELMTVLLDARQQKQVNKKKIFDL